MSYPQYATDWHQCRRCGCKRPDKTLRTLQLSDPVLKLDSEVFQCVDEQLCERLKKDVELQRQTQQGLSPAVPIRDRSKP